MYFTLNLIIGGFLGYLLAEQDVPIKPAILIMLVANLFTLTAFLANKGII